MHRPQTHPLTQAEAAGTDTKERVLHADRENTHVVAEAHRILMETGAFVSDLSVYAL